MILALLIASAAFAAVQTWRVWKLKRQLREADDLLAEAMKWGSGWFKAFNGKDDGVLDADYLEKR